MKLDRIGLAYCLAALCALPIPLQAQTGAPPVEQDCASGETAHEVYARDNAGGGTLGQRLHFCIKSAAHGMEVFEQARSEIARDPFSTPAMRASLLRQIDAKIAMFRRSG